MISETNHGYELDFVTTDRTFDDKYTDDGGATFKYYKKNTYLDFGLVMTDLYIPMPKPKRSVIDIPFASGSIDITDATGVTPYEDREGLKFEFFLNDKSPELWSIAIQKLSMYLHGRKLKMKTEYDPQYYYVVRLNVDPTKSNQKSSKIVLTGTAEPFKYSLIASNEPWHWDPFSFIDGEIKETTADISVNGSKTIPVYAGGIMTSPTFYVYSSQNLKVVFEDTQYDLSKSNPSKAYEVYRFPQIRVGDEDVNLTFTGTGVVSVEYRGRFL